VLHPKFVGDRCVLAVMSVLHARGCTVSVPFGENARYDIVADDGARLLRMQCKAGRLRHGAVYFSTASTYGHHARPRHGRRAYHGEIDAFGVYCAEIGCVYVVPVEDAMTRTQAALRVTPSRNRQRHGVRPASHYLAGTLALEARGVAG
jgi:hypothetical protein